MATPETNGPNSRAVAEAAARAIAPTDPIIQALLVRKTLGEKLTSTEYGTLGNFKAKQMRDGALPRSASEATASGPLAPWQNQSTSVQSQTADNGTPLSLADSAFVSRTVEALLISLNSIGQRYLAAQARIVAANAQKVGVPAPNVSRFETADVVSPAHKAVMVETAPLVCEALGVNPKHVPMGAFFGSAGLVGLDFYSAVTELKEANATITEALKKLGERQPEPPKQVSAPAPASVAASDPTAPPPTREIAPLMREQNAEPLKAGKKK